MFHLTTKFQSNTVRLLSATLLTVAAAFAQCNTGHMSGCGPLITTYNPENGSSGTQVDGNWKLAYPAPSSPSNPATGTAAQQKLIENPCSGKFDTVYVDYPDGQSPDPPVFGYWSTEGSTSASDWISPLDEVNQLGGIYIYSTTFTSPGSWTVKVHVTGQLQSDNEVYSIYGKSPAKKGCQFLGGLKYVPPFTGSGALDCPTCFNSWTPFSTDWFYVTPSSTTTLYFLVRNRGVSGLDSNPTPTGLRVEFNSTTGTNLTGSTGADLNGDGQTDLAVVDNGTNKVAVYLNTKGEFTKDTEYPVGTNPVAVAAGDLNGDGRPDLAVANLGSGTVSILLNSGKGRFSKQVSYPAGSSPAAIAIGDLNGDGIPDLAVANANSGTITILLGDGKGGFEAAQTVSVGDPTASSPSSIAIADLNQDGYPDLAMTDHGTGAVIVLFGSASGTFQAATYPTGAVEPDSIAVGDLNGDGIPDLIFSDPATQAAYVMLGSSTGLQAAQPYSVGTNPQGLILAGGSGGTGTARMQAAVVNPQSGSVIAMPVNSDGSLGAPMGISAGSNPVSLVALPTSTGTSLAVVDNGSSSIVVTPVP